MLKTPSSQKTLTTLKLEPQMFDDFKETKNNLHQILKFQNSTIIFGHHRLYDGFTTSQPTPFIFNQQFFMSLFIL